MFVKFKVPNPPMKDLTVWVNPNCVKAVTENSSGSTLLYGLNVLSNRTTVTVRGDVQSTLNALQNAMNVSRD